MRKAIRARSHHLLALIVTVLLASLLVLPALAFTATPPIVPDSIPLRLSIATFDPLLQGPPDVPAGLTVDLPQSGPAYLLVQFDGPIQAAWRQALEAQGAGIVDYIPDFAYVVRTESRTATGLAALPHVRWTGAWLPAYRLAPELLDRLNRPDQAGAEPMAVRMASYPGADGMGLAAGMAALGIDPGPASASDWGLTWRFTATPQQLAGLATLPDVRWIEPFVEPQWLNDQVQNSWLLGTANVWNDLSLYGQNQVVGVADSGLDTGNLSTVHQDVRGRIQQAIALGRPNDWSDPNGHGTHVTGSVLGNGTLSGSSPATHQYAGSAAGSAPEARLIMQSVMDAGGGLGGLPADLNDLFQQAYSAGARIHTNSWGANVDGFYDLDAQNVDQFNWNHKDMTILFAAGNAGVDANNDGVVDPDSINSPGTAKNSITVGASEGQRYTSASDIWRWYGYNANPIRDDLTSDNHWGMAAFSSRGPTNDNRIKPDVVTPGSNIRSLRSSLAPGSGNYTLLSGTSMATPLTAGMSALIRQWYQQAQGVANPSAALIKATLLNGAMRINPGQYGTGATQEIPNTWPNNVAGWGRSSVRHSIDPAAPRTVRFKQGSGLNTGGSVTYYFRHTPASYTPEQLAELARGSAVDQVQEGPAGREPDASVNVLESSVAPGAIINVQASGFPANQNATVTLDGANVGTLSGNASGSWTFRVLLDTELPRGSHTLAVTSGSSASDTFQVVGGKDGSFRVTLVWTDYPGANAANVKLVNDLDLSVTGPGGGTTGGNNTTDRRNNVEEVWLSDAPAGIYQVRVSAYNVPQGAQPFALVVSGDNLSEVSGQGTPRAYLPLILKRYGAPAATSTPTPTRTPTPTATATATPGGGIRPRAGYWSNTGDSISFTVTADRAHVDDFAIIVSVTGCGVYQITHTPLEPIDNGSFSFDGSFYGSCAFSSNTSCSGSTGLNQFVIPGCGSVSGGPWAYSAAWQHATANPPEQQASPMVVTRLEPGTADEALEASRVSR